MRALMTSSLAALSFIAFSGIAAAACFEGHNLRTASDMTKPKEAETVGTYDGQVKLPGENADKETAPVKTGE